MYDANKQSFIRIYNFSRVLDPEFKDKEIQPTLEIACNPDFRFISFVWGALDKSFYVSTTNGRIIQYDTSNGKTMNEA